MCIIHYHFNVNYYFVFKSLSFLLNKYIYIYIYIRKNVLNLENNIFKIFRKPFFSNI